MPRYRLTIAYDGADFHGWQKQEPPDPDAPADAETGERPRLKLRTVQEVVERAVREVVREPVHLQGASRTDSGVHARAQCGAFTTTGDASDGRGWPAERGTLPLLRAINSRLPQDVLIADVELTHDRFDPIKDAEAKGYSYTIHASPHRALWSRRTTFHSWHALDPERMAEAAKHLVGEHDFAALAAANHGRLTTVRTIYGCTATATPPEDPVERDRAGGDFEPVQIRIDVNGNGFLYNMVRILAGTLMEVGRGKIEPGDILEILKSKDRRRAGPTLPPEGLCLEWIRYPR
ncbi:MAG: tRNA pseudouridine synthase A [Planctomycetota bacterium]